MKLSTFVFATSVVPFVSASFSFPPSCQRPTSVWPRTLNAWRRGTPYRGIGSFRPRPPFRPPFVRGPYGNSQQGDGLPHSMYQRVPATSNSKGQPDLSSSDSASSDSSTYSTDQFSNTGTCSILSNSVSQVARKLSNPTVDQAPLKLLEDDDQDLIDMFDFCAEAPYSVKLMFIDHFYVVLEASEVAQEYGCQSLVFHTASADGVHLEKEMIAFTGNLATLDELGLATSQSVILSVGDYKLGDMLIAYMDAKVSAMKDDENDIYDAVFNNSWDLVLNFIQEIGYTPTTAQKKVLANIILDKFSEMPGKIRKCAASMTTGPLSNIGNTADEEVVLLMLEHHNQGIPGGSCPSEEEEETEGTRKLLRA